MRTPFTRRAALAGVLPALAAVSLPVSAASLPTAAAAALAGHPDAELFACGPRWRPVRARHQAAITVTDNAHDAYYAIALPEPIEPAYPDGDRLGDEFVARIRALPPSPQWSAYKAAKAEWNAEMERLREKCRVPEADAAQEEAADAEIEVLDQIADIPATTIEGLRFKAWICQVTDGYPEVMASIVDDLLAMG